MVQNEYQYETRSFSRTFFETSALYDYKVELPVTNVIKLHGSMSWMQERLKSEVIKYKAETTLLPNISELTSEQIAFINYFDIANYVNILAVIKKKMSPQTYEQYATALASYLSLLTLQSFVYSAEQQLERAVSIFASNKEVPEEVTEQMHERIITAKKSLSKLIEDYQKSVALLRKTEKLYRNMRAEIDSQVAQTLGKPSLLFSF